MTSSLEARLEQKDFLEVPANAKTKRRIVDLEPGTMAIVRRKSVVPYINSEGLHGIAVRTNEEIPEHIDEKKMPVGVFHTEIQIGKRAVTGFVVDGRRANLFTESRLRKAKTLEELEYDDPVTPLIVSYKDNLDEVQRTGNWYDRQPYLESLTELEEWLDEYYDATPGQMTEADRIEEEGRRDIGKFLRDFGGRAIKSGLPIAANVLAPEVGIPLLVAQEVAPHAVKAIARRFKK